MNELLKERARLGKQAFEYGVALHHGRVMYGNVGAPTRLDFTVIGPAVNLTARLEAICTRCGMGLVVTPEFASVIPDRFSSLGMFKMRGVVGEMEVFGRKREEGGQ